MNAMIYGSLLLMFSALIIGYLMDKVGIVTTITDEDGNTEQRSAYYMVLEYALYLYVVYSIIGAVLFRGRWP